MIQSMYDLTYPQYPNEHNPGSGVLQNQLVNCIYTRSDQFMADRCFFRPSSGSYLLELTEPLEVYFPFQGNDL